MFTSKTRAQKEAEILAYLESPPNDNFFPPYFWRVLVVGLGLFALEVAFFAAIHFIRYL